MSSCPSISSFVAKSTHPSGKQPNLGRKGDQRMHKAVAVRLANPDMSLLNALQYGGFEFPITENVKSKRMIQDSNRVMLCQRKNQLSRRLRLVNKKKERELNLLVGTFNKNSFFYSSKKPLLKKKLLKITKYGQIDIQSNGFIGPTIGNRDQQKSNKGTISPSSKLEQRPNTYAESYLFNPSYLITNIGSRSISHIPHHNELRLQLPDLPRNKYEHTHTREKENSPGLEFSISSYLTDSTTTRQEDTGIRLGFIATKPDKHGENNSRFLSKYTLDDFSNNNSIISEEEKIKLALNLFRMEQPVLIKRIMLMAGFDQRDVDENSILYQYISCKVLRS